MKPDDYPALERILADRWTCRQFRGDPVPVDVIERLLQLAQRTPSWCNTQPWQVIVTAGTATDRFRTELLAQIERGVASTSDIEFPAQYTGAFRDRRRDCGKQLYESLGIVKGDRERTSRQMLRNFELFDAPHVAIITTEADLGIYGAVDCGLYLNSFLLGAHALGLAAAPQAALATYSPFLREHFDIPENRRVVAGVSFGYADLEHAVNAFRTARADLADVVTWHTT